MQSRLAIAAILLSIIIIGAVLSSVYMMSLSPVILTNEATFSGNIELEGETRIHSIRVTENATEMHCILICGGNDFDLYGRFSLAPTTSEYDFRGYAVGSEDLYYEYPEAGIWHLMVHSFSGIGHYDLSVAIQYT